MTSHTDDVRRAAAIHTTMVLLSSGDHVVALHAWCSGLVPMLIQAATALDVMGSVRDAACAALAIVAVCNQVRFAVLCVCVCVVCSTCVGWVGVVLCGQRLWSTTLVNKCGQQVWSMSMGAQDVQHPPVYKHTHTHHTQPFLVTHLLLCGGLEALLLRLSDPADPMTATAAAAIAKLAACDEGVRRRVVALGGVPALVKVMTMGGEDGRCVGSSC